MNAREERGKQIASAGKIEKVTATRWLVPSQTSSARYFVDLANINEPACSCPDYEERRLPCKHVYAVAYTVVKQNNPDGSVTVMETMTVTKRKTYPQVWPAYNAAQTNEQDKFQALLHDLCIGIPEPEPKGGRPPLPIKDMLFSAIFKVYSTFSGRRFMSDLREANERGYIWKTPHYNSIFRYLESDALTPILQSMVKQSSLPLASVEVDFAVDSSGFSTSKFVRWFDHKYGRIRSKERWVKAHVICGVKTNIITAIELGDEHTGDSPQLPTLLKTTAQSFKIREISADAAYGSTANVAAITEHKATPFIAFKSNATGKVSPLWEKMFHYFLFKREEYLEHFHKRSNVESTFSMVKRKFGDSLRSKTDVSLFNEALAKAICHNLVVVIHEMYELGIEPMFWNNGTA